jgi:hypothetical protein
MQILHSDPRDPTHVPTRHEAASRPPRRRIRQSSRNLPLLCARRNRTEWWSPRHEPRAQQPPRAAGRHAPGCRGQSVRLHDGRRVDSLEDELRDAVAALDGEVDVPEIEEDDAHVAAVVGVDDASSGVDRVLPGESRPRSCARGTCTSVHAATLPCPPPSSPSSHAPTRP